MTVEAFAKKYYKYIVAVIIVIFTGISLLNAWNDGATYDEIAHIPAGYSYLTEGDFRINPEHPPLFKVLAGIPLLALDINFDTSLPFWNEINDFGEYQQWKAGRHIMYEAGNDGDQILFWSRVPIIILSVFFGLFLLHWGRQLAGITAGLFVLLLYAFDPNILGHNHYVTTDLGIAFAIAVAFYFFLHFLKEPTWSNAIVGGVFLGIAQLTKFSAIMLIPIFAAFLIAYPLFRISKDGGKARFFFATLGKGTVALFTAVIVIWLVYIPVTINMPAEVLENIGPGRIAINDRMRNQISLDFILAANESPITRPIAIYSQGVVQVFQRVAGGNDTFFLGNVSADASAWYFPVVFLTKNTIPHLLFYTFGAVIFVLLVCRSVGAVFMQSPKRSWQRFVLFVNNHFTLLAIGSFSAFYAYISITGNLNIGFRHLFPILPFLYILVATTSIDFIRSMKNRELALILRYSGYALTVCMIAVTLAAYPYYMSYFNQIVGGSKNGYLFVTDSNADWGQDLKRLRTYLNEHPEIDKIRVDYFGGGKPESYFPEKFIPWWRDKRPIEPGYYAISVLFRQESIHDTKKADNETYRWLLEYEPIDQVGTSILIYHIPEDQL